MKIILNPYLLGLWLLLGEMAINMLVGLAGFGHVAVVIMLSSIAGIVYSRHYQQQMPSRERFKTLAVYIILAGVIGGGTLIAQAQSLDASPAIILSLFAATLAVYAILMYFSLGLKAYVRSSGQ